MNKIGTFNALYILVEGVIHPVAFGRKCSISATTSFDEVASKTNGKFAEYVPGLHSFKVTSDSILSNDESVIWNIFRNSKNVTILYGDIREADGYMFRGDAVISSLKLNGKIHNMASFSIELVGNGELEYTQAKININLQYWIKNGTINIITDYVLKNCTAKLTFPRPPRPYIATYPSDVTSRSYSVTGVIGITAKISSIELSGENKNIYSITPICKTQTATLLYGKHHDGVYVVEFIGGTEWAGDYVYINYNDGSSQVIKKYMDTNHGRNTTFLELTDEEGATLTVRPDTNDYLTCSVVKCTSPNIVYYRCIENENGEYVMQAFMASSVSVDINIPSLNIEIPAGNTSSNTIILYNDFTQDDAYKVIFNSKLQKTIVLTRQRNVNLFFSEKSELCEEEEAYKEHFTATLAEALGGDVDVTIHTSEEDVVLHIPAGSTTAEGWSYYEMNSMDIECHDVSVNIVVVKSAATVELVCLLNRGGSSGTQVLWCIKDNKFNNGSDIVIAFDETVNGTTTHRTETIRTGSRASSGHYCDVTNSSQISNIQITDADGRSFTYEFETR